MCSLLPCSPLHAPRLACSAAPLLSSYRTVTAKSSIQKSCSSEDDFCIIFLVLGSVGLLGSGVFFSILDLQARRSREMQILRMNPSAPETKNWTKDDPGKTEPGAASQDIAGLSKTGIR
jgi:hypothetical protein